MTTGALDEFGIGVSLYFKTLPMLFSVLMLCAFISLVAINENKNFNPPIGTGANHTSAQYLGSVIGAQRSDLYFNKQAASDIAVVVVIGVFCIFAHFAEGKVADVSSTFCIAILVIPRMNFFLLSV